MPVILTDDVAFSTGTGAGNITFGSTLNSEANEANNLSLTAGTGNVTFIGAVGAVENQQLGAIAIESATNLEAASTIQAGSLRYLSGTGTINLQGNIITTDAIGVNLTTTGNIRTEDITSNGGNISLTSNKGDVTTGTLDASSASGTGGAIALISPTGAVTSGDLRATGATGGTVTVISGDRINTGNIDVSASIGKGGTVLLDPPNDVEVGFINAQGGTEGGTVDITTERFFQARDTFTDRNGLLSSISTAGGTGKGEITIRHGGGDLRTPFVVGDATTNGTAAALTTGADTILSTRFFPGSFTLGNIQIITSDRLVSEINRSTILEKNPPSQEAIANIPRVSIDSVIEALEDVFTREYEAYLGLPTPAPIQSLEGIRTQLLAAQRTTGVNSALLYIAFGRGALGLDALVTCPKEELLQKRTEEIASRASRPVQQEACDRSDSDEIEVVLVTASGPPIRHRVAGGTRSQILAEVKQFQAEVTDPATDYTKSYLALAQQLYQQLIAPLETELQARGIQNLVFIPDVSLRTLPMAALHNGQEFIVEQYSVSLMPSFSLTKPQPADLKNASVLAMGASKFTAQDPLPAVPRELYTITPQLWTGRSFLNQAFTLSNLKSQRASKPYRIVHLATHAEFLPGEPSNSYIQFWDTKLGINQMKQLEWKDPPVELLTLSACRTAIGNEDVELGFGGLAAQTGVKSVLASLWYVSDVGTLGLITEFYEQLKTAPSRAEALRHAQVAIIRKQVYMEGDKLYGSVKSGISLPPELRQLGNQDLSHPRYWAAFTMIGNPW